MLKLIRWIASKCPKAFRLSVWYDVFVERYYPLGYGVPRENGAPSRFAAWPNIFLHRFAKQLDEFAHDHGRWAISIIVFGGYEEWRPRWGGWRTRKAGDVTFQAYDEPHLIRNSLPDTWTVFITGPFVRPYLVYRPDGVISREGMVEKGERPLTSVLPVTPELERKIMFRQRARARFQARRAA